MKKEFPEHIVIPKLTRLSAPGKLIFLSIHTQAIPVDGHKFKRVLVYGDALYWRRKKRKTNERREHYTFENAFDFWQWVTSKVNKRETIFLYAHDASVDFLSLDGFRLLPCLDFTLTSIYHKFTTLIVRFSNGSRRVVVVDTKNYYPLPLDRLARSFGVDLPALPDCACVCDGVREYNRAKVELLAGVVQNLIRETVEAERGSLKLTSSSTSHSIFRHAFMRHKIVTNHNPEVVAFEQAAYVGGYTGLKKLIEPGAPDLYKLDVNSMYPSVMLNAKFPVKLVAFAKDASVKRLERWLEEYLVIARVTLRPKSAIYPLNSGEFNYYPVGEFETVLSTASLKHALKSDAIERVGQMAVYLGEPIFSDFVKDTFARRMDARGSGNLAHEIFYKTINNTLYGKFGQRETETLRVGDAPPDEFEMYDAFDGATGEAWQELHAGGSVLFVYKRGESQYTSFAIAAHVTDYARMKLFRLEALAGRENVFYMDTDSLIVNMDGMRRLSAEIAPDKIGRLKLEEAAPFFVGFAKKDYIFGETRKLKGFANDGKRDEGNVLKTFQKIGMGGAMRQSLAGGAFWREVNKYYKPFVVNEHIEADGSISPLRLPEEAGLINYRHYTTLKVRELAGKMLRQDHLSLLNNLFAVS